ncbi:uncharacterized protein B0I36DRAFT_28334 [Microdochium trichocladiopsis]|uniref:Uncharacterized protein n=1 Tax=Microdochium trichocladiopsis TaxID=1682393 RepID=A0A9P8XVQ7_9PEZI|nr:uncharacterized protein B0I36DRAFT_28334 [Microdochium trichocladiopsis]KAH7021050.1 hypothetical protein B0I36DRAFT_28334 [Microdochium trichocladiopsis]
MLAGFPTEHDSWMMLPKRPSCTIWQDRIGLRNTQSWENRKRVASLAADCHLCDFDVRALEVHDDHGDCRSTEAVWQSLCLAAQWGEPESLYITAAHTTSPPHTSPGSQTTPFFPGCMSHSIHGLGCTSCSLAQIPRLCRILLERPALQSAYGAACACSCPSRDTGLHCATRRFCFKASWTTSQCRRRRANTTAKFTLWVLILARGVIGVAPAHLYPAQTRQYPSRMALLSVGLRMPNHGCSS